jgi:hypothetical protein
VDLVWAVDERLGQILQQVLQHSTTPRRLHEDLSIYRCL